MRLCGKGEVWCKAVWSETEDYMQAMHSYSVPQPRMLMLRPLCHVSECVCVCVCVCEDVCQLPIAPPRG